jgi:hypothetical protein
MGLSGRWMGVGMRQDRFAGVTQMAMDKIRSQKVVFFAKNDNLEVRCGRGMRSPCRPPCRASRPACAGPAAWGAGPAAWGRPPGAAAINVALRALSFSPADPSLARADTRLS